MNIAFAGFRHSHIVRLYNFVKEHNQVNLIGCFEADKDAREQTEEKDQIVFNYHSYEEILQDKRVDVVGIGDYYAKRGKMVIDALKHGKHVICDKPICTDLNELEEIKKIAFDKQLQVMCMLDLRYLPQVDKVKELIEAGEIGEVQIASFTGQHFLDYGNRPNWYFEEGKHGGTINDIAIHGVDLIRYLTGKNLTKINCAKVWNAFADQEPAFKDCGQFIIEMDKMSVMADVSYAAPKYNILPTYWDFYFWGKKGMIHFSLREDTIIYLYKDTETIIECQPNSPSYLDDFIREVNGEKTRMDTKDILESQRQVLLIQRHADEKEE